MPSFRDRLKTFLRGPDLEGEARRTYRFHLAYAVLDATAGGLLLNMPQLALRMMGAPNWHLPLRDLYSGLGMLATLYLGSWMAPRHKMPFVFLPGMFSGITLAGMTLAMGDPFWFLTFLSISGMFEVTTRPAIAAIVRLNYPVEHRGEAAGTVREWSSLAFLASSLSSAYLLQHAGDDALAAALGQIICAALLSLSSFVCFRQIRVQEDLNNHRRDLKPEVLRNLRDALAVVVRDGRYRRYLAGCLLDGFCAWLYFPLIWTLLSKELGFDFLAATVFMHSLPALVAFASTGLLGHWFDRTNPWIAWAGIRFAWGIDALLLAATPFVASQISPAVWILPVLGRLLRGSVQGGQWVMWWQIGVTHFAPPGEHTSRYTGMMVFVNGATKLAGSATAIALTARGIPATTLLAVGGTGVILAGLYSLWQAGCDRKEHRPATIAEFEAQFGVNDP
jgi:MFS family permease